MCDPTRLTVAGVAIVKLDNDRLNKIYDKTRGICHLCHKQLVFCNYGNIDGRGAWEVEHSKPKSRGGTDHLNNLYPACISCNREKGNGTNYSIRSKNAVRKAPLSGEMRRKALISRATKGALAGAAVGRLLGPGGMLIGGTLGILIAGSEDPDE